MLIYIHLIIIYWLLLEIEFVNIWNKYKHNYNILITNVKNKIKVKLDNNVKLYMIYNQNLDNYKIINQQQKKILVSVIHVDKL